MSELEHEEGQDNFKGEGAAVHKVAVEDVGVGGRRQAVDLEDVQQIVKLAVYVAAHRHVRVRHRPLRVRRRQREGHERLLGLEQSARLDEQLDDVFLVHQFLVAEALQRLRNELVRHLAVGVEARAVVVRLDGERRRVDGLRQQLRLLAQDSIGKGHLLHRLVALLELHARVAVGGLELGHRFKVPQGKLVLAEREVCRAASVIRFDVRRVDADRRLGVCNSEAV
mmetsp:Transcript_6530/g.21048  ORF Transcript_6530/g.21048 Transcript_6530/m.21048 type:complete len:225 (+) Transcript_6530:756-1430(+)